jgi:ElaB/YqjD/DUF883 family membrane-anchored ribosome-binding protein
MGAQVRDWAQEKGSQLKEGAQEAMQQAGATASQLANRGREAMQQAGATASQLADRGRETMDQFEEGLEDRIRNKPLQSVLIAAGVGMLLGLIWKR